MGALSSFLVAVARLPQRWQVDTGSNPLANVSRPWDVGLVNERAPLLLLDVLSRGETGTVAAVFLLRGHYCIIISTVSVSFQTVS
mmetsp:Transcript_56426/g.85328  ORF Transcript_56426/g.85328 Transcript_56426/m.85328 type:complete len:85 (-) Transcript_56426:586-840(-)